MIHSRSTIKVQQATRSVAQPEHTLVSRVTSVCARSAFDRLCPHAHGSGATSEGGGAVAPCFLGRSVRSDGSDDRRVGRQLFNHDRYPFS